MTSCVYALVNPIDNKIFYVGKVGKRGYKTRLKEHIEDAILGKGNALKNSVIRLILEKSMKIKVIILEYVFDDNKLSNIEKYWIKIYQKLNKFLTNWGKSETHTKQENVIKSEVFEYSECIYPFDVLHAEKSLVETKTSLNNLIEKRKFEQLEFKEKYGLNPRWNIEDCLDIKIGRIAEYLIECAIKHWNEAYV